MTGTAPQLLEQFGISADTAAENLIAAGDNPERNRSEAASAKLAGISPSTAGSGMTSGKTASIMEGTGSSMPRSTPP